MDYNNNNINNNIKQNDEDQAEIVYDNRRPEKREDGRVTLLNPHLKNLKEDTLYHLSLNTREHDFEALFGDVKFVCTGGTHSRMKAFALYAAKELNLENNLIDWTKTKYASDRYSIFKVGPVLSVSHGMGISSLSILMHELFKLVYYAKCTNVVFFRIGTSGGIGIPGGTVVITDKAVDELLRPYLELNILGKKVRRPCSFDLNVNNELMEIANSQKNKYETIFGTTMCCMDFYETQTRLDGAFCNYTKEDKQKRLEYLSKCGIVNIEMETLLFGAYCHYAGISGAVVCTTLLDRLLEDQLTSSKEDMIRFQSRPQKLVMDFIKKRLGVVNFQQHEIIKNKK